MRALVAAACVAVLAAVSYYFWGEYKKAQAISEERAHVEEIRKDLFWLAKADRNDTGRVRQYCQTAETGLTVPWLQESHDIWRQVVKNCRYLGYI